MVYGLMKLFTKKSLSYGQILPGGGKLFRDQSGILLGLDKYTKSLLY